MNCWVLNVGFSGPEAAKGEIRRPFLERERERETIHSFGERIGKERGYRVKREKRRK